jgi:pyruvate,water dikinase
MLRTDTFWVMPRMVAYAAPGFLTLALARRLLGDLARPGQLATVLRGLPHNVTTEMDLALWQLTEEIRRVEIARQAFLESTVPELTVAYQAGALPRVAERGLAAFLAAYGHRAVAEIDLGMPRWSADPAHLLGVIKNYLSLDDPALAPPNQFSRGAHEAEEVIAGLVGRLSAEHPTRAGVVRWSLRRTRQLAGLRESPKFLLVLILARLRDHLQRVGDSLVEARAIAEPEDIFFLDLAEARRGLQGEAFSSVVAERRAAYATELQRRHVPRVLLSDGTELEALAGSATGAGASDETGVLHGSPASAGTVTGLARVVLDPVGAEVRPGEILIAPSTDPGWTPLFLTAGGLVMEMGGSNSHGAVVAREYGIPAVVGVRDATSKIATGQAVTVDGAAGLVRVG